MPLHIKRECTDFGKKRATKNASLKTSTKNVLCGSTEKIKFQACQGLLIVNFLDKMKNEMLNWNI